MNFVKFMSRMYLAREDMTSGIFDEFGFDTDSAVLIFRILLAIAGGIVIAAIISVYDKRYLGSFIRKLIEDGCTSKDSAKSLYDLGFDDKLGVRLALRRGYVYSRFVVCVEQEEHEETMQKARKAFYEAHEGDKKPPKFKEIPFRADYDTAQFYIPEDKLTDASDKFSAKGSNWMGLFIVLLILAVILGLCILFLPKILELAGLLLS